MSDLKNKSWTEEVTYKQENSALNSLVNEYGLKSWMKISEVISRMFTTPRTAKQCRDRWHNYANPKIKNEA